MPSPGGSCRHQRAASEAASEAATATAEETATIVIMRARHGHVLRGPSRSGNRACLPFHAPWLAFVCCRPAHFVQALWANHVARHRASTVRAKLRRSRPVSRHRVKPVARHRASRVRAKLRCALGNVHQDVHASCQVVMFAPQWPRQVYRERIPKSWWQTGSLAGVGRR